MRAWIFFAIFWAACPLFSQNYNLTLRSTLAFPGQTLANVWGIKKNGKEYALVGASQGLAIVDVTDPDAPFLLTQLTDDINSSWREVKTFGDFAYVTSEGLAPDNTGGVGIADLSNLPDPNVPFHKYKGDGAIANQLKRSHSLHIDTVQGYAYIYGATGLANGGAIALNLSPDPFNPVYEGMYSGSYIHDGYAHDDIVYGAHIYGGYFSVIDFTDKASPQLLATQNTPNNFTHNTWLSADGSYLFTTDETSSSFLAAYDISDLNNIFETDRIQTTPGSGSIVHNTHIKDHYAITSWYRDGVTIVDVERPSNLVQVGRFDTYTAGSGSGFQGAWGVYPYLPSGNLLVSNIQQTGLGGVLYVLTPNYSGACYLEGNVKDASNNQNLFGVSVEIIHTDPLNSTTSGLNGNYATGQPTAGTFNVTFTKSGYLSKTLPATLSNGNVTALDVSLDPIALPLEWVTFEATAQGSSNLLHWVTASEQNTLRFEVQAKSNPKSHWVSIGEMAAAGFAPAESRYTFTDTAPGLVTYYRIKTTDRDGQVDFSPVVAVNRPNPTFGFAKIYPTPATGQVQVEISSDRPTLASLRVFNMAGGLMMEQLSVELSGGIDHLTLILPQDWPAGRYFLELQDGARIEQATLLLQR